MYLNKHNWHQNMLVQMQDEFGQNDANNYWMSRCLLKTLGLLWELWTVQNFCHEFPIDQNSLRIYTKLVGTSQTDNDSTTNPENCQFLEIRGIRGSSVIGVLRILTNPGQFLAILGIRGRSVIGA